MKRVPFPAVNRVRGGQYCCSFALSAGTVCVVVTPLSGSCAEVQVTEREAALAAWRDSSVIERTGDSLEMASARNRFGTGLILGVLRCVKDMFPWVKEWVWERKSGANHGRKGVRDGGR